jgi:hypothetical protein
LHESHVTRVACKPLIIGTFLAIWGGLKEYTNEEDDYGTLRIRTCPEAKQDDLP